MSLELIKQVNDRYIDALAFHRTSADAFAFLSLYGFAQIHEYQYTEEAQTQRRLKLFLTRTYNHLISDAGAQTFDLLDAKIKNKKRSELQAADFWQAAQSAFSKYRQWEAETLELYEEITQQLSSSGDVVGSDYVKNLAVSINLELQYITDLMTAYNAIDWSMEQIRAEQDALQEKYIYRVRELYKDFPEYHHFNSV